MSSPNLPDGAFFTTINGRRCTAIPKEGAARTSTTTPNAPSPTTQQSQPTPPADDPPQRQQPEQPPSPPPQRDPPQAEPPRQTPVNPPAREQETTSTAPPTQEGQNTPEADVSPPTTTDGAGSFITTAPLGPGAGEEAATTGTGPSISGAPTGSGSSSGDDSSNGLPIAAIVGGVVGGVAFLTMLALLFWFWKKNRKRRRSTLLTPLGTPDENNFGSARKERPYIFDQESVGPTPKAARFRAALGYNLQRVKGQVGGMFAVGHDRSTSSVLSKDRSAYSNISPHSRNSSLLSPPVVMGAGAPTTKERLTNWKERLAAIAFFRGRSEKTLDPDPFAGVREKDSAAAAPGAQPDFLTLLGMDERAVEREAHRRRASRRHGSTASMERFLGDLGINIDNNANANPFADANAIPDEPKRAAPVNPFADSNAITPAPPVMAMRPGHNYVADVRRSRNLSVSGLTTRPTSLQRPRSPRYDSLYRASGESVESFATRRARCRSDPFDLDRPELLSFGPMPSGSPEKPGMAHMRNDSFGSKYSSGIYSAGWSEPGPDVGTEPVVVGGRFSPNSGWRPGAFPGREDRKRMSGGSQESRETQKTVGKAM